MKRPFLLFGAAFALGVFGARETGIPPGVFVLSGLLTVLLLPFFKKKVWFAALIAVSFVFLGALAEATEAFLPRHHLAGKFSGTGFVTLQGEIISYPEIKRKGRRESVSWVLEAKQLQIGKQKQRVRGKVLAYALNPKIFPEYGDEILFRGRLARPESVVNPGQFDYRRFLELKGIHHLVYGYGARCVRISRRRPGSLFNLLFRIRRELKRRMEAFAPYPAHEVLAALLIGMRKGIPEAIEEDFVRTGTAHVLAVSGLNVSIVGGLFFGFLRRLRVPRNWSAGGTLLFILLYALISGYNAPVMRAGLMGIIVMGGILLEKESDLINSLAVAFFAILFVNPRSLFSAGFQLSFISVLAMALIIPQLRTSGPARHPLRRILRFLRDVLLTTIAASAGTFPLLIYYFRMVSPVGLLANLAAVPLMNLGTFAGFLTLPAAFLPLRDAVIQFLLAVPCGAIDLCLKMNHALARIPFASFFVPSPPAWAIAAYYAGFALLIRHAGEIRAKISKPWPLAALALSVLICFLLASKAGKDVSLKVHLLHLKRSRVAFLELPGRSENILINTGGGNSGGEWKWIVKPFLAHHGVRTIHHLFFSSLYERDAGGFQGLPDHFYCRKVYLPPVNGRFAPRKRDLIRAAEERNIAWSPFRPGQILSFVPSVELRWEQMPGQTLLRIRYGGHEAVVVLDGVNAANYDRAVTFVLDPRKTSVECFPAK